jgi:hypothetical protein
MPAVAGTSEISFSAAKYDVAENEGSYAVKVKRQGGNDRPVSVLFKTADFMASYGEDYIVLDGEGNELPLSDGIAPAPEDFKETTAEAVYKSDDLTSLWDLGEISDEKTTVEAVYGQAIGTGSPLLDAQAKYLKLPNDRQQAVESIESVLTDINKYFKEARGAYGIITFKEGESEKEITIKIIDNDRPGADKIVMLALMGVNGDSNTKLAANPTAYLNILDDEEYQKPVIKPDAAEVTLTGGAQEYTLTLERTAGVDYYTSVKVSTVKETAVEGVDYDKMEDVSIAFAPGEVTKTLRLSAKNFDGDKSYGIRLESDGTCDITKEYIRVNIRSSEPAARLMGNNSQAELAAYSQMVPMASGITVGSAKTEVWLADIPGGWGSDKTTGDHDGWADWSGNYPYRDLRVYESTKNAGRAWITWNKQNLVGIDSIDFNTQVYGDGSDFTTWFELESERRFFGSVRSNSYNGRTGWTWKNLNISGINDSYYIKFMTRANAYGNHNPIAQLGNPLKYNWRLFTFDTSHSRQYYHRFSYDYADKSGEAMKISFTEGRDDYDYLPGTAHLVNASGTTVNAFYANANTFIKPVADNASNNAKYGIELEGVYLYSKTDAELYNKDMTSPYKEHWYENNAVWVPATGVTVNQDFVKNLVFRIGNVSSVKVMPKFKQQTATLNIHNTDSEKTYIANMTGKGLASYRDWGSNGYYNQYTFPMYSQIKVRAVAAPRKTVTGFYIDLWSKSTAEDPIFADSGRIERMTYTLNESMSFYPRTENQGMNIAYMPNTNKILNDLTGRVYREPRVVDKSTTVERSDKNGDINITTVYPGLMWIMRATAPEGYYVKWTNGTGDIKNVNGRIDVSRTNPNINEETANTKRGNYNPVYGDIMSGTINQDNTKYYYEFVKANGQVTGRVWGNVQRETGSFYDVAYNKRLPYEPVSSTQVSIAGTAVFTDQNGDFSAELKNVPTSGLVSVLIDDSGTQYPVTALANYMSITLPAYECFKPKSISVRYNDGTANKINGTVANIKDDTLNVITQVESSGSIQPTAARYYLHKTNGTVINCSTDNRFKLSFANDTGTLSFNPKSVMDSGDRLYAAFIDQNDKEYKAMDIGYSFVAPLNLKTFMFPLIGSSLLSDTYDAATELIGDPLGDVSLGKIGFNEPETDTVTPPGMDPAKYQYIMSTYKFGDFSKALKTFSSKDDKDKDDKDDASKKEADSVKKATKDAGKDTEGGGYKTKKSFSWSLSPKAAFALQVSTRNVGGEWKYYFEELDFLVGADYEVKGSMQITLPIGMNIIITGSLSGDVAGVFQLKTNYSGDSTWDKNKVEYSPESFGLFEEIDHVDRSAYIMLNPTVTMGLGISYAIVEVGGNANFEFDMDFKFDLNKGALGKHMYGDMTYSFDYYIKVLSLKVYSGKTDKETVELFSVNADGHIEPDIIAGLLGMEGSKIQSEPVARDYLYNASAWNSGMKRMALSGTGAAESTTEETLMEGAYPSSKFKLTKIGEESILMLFIGDVPDRSAINRTGLYYSIYDGAGWSEPELVENDGTLDDYVDAFDLGDKVLVSWSSADCVLGDDATVAEALTALDIKTAFFDKGTQTFGGVTRITKTTDEDFTADTEPRAAYDSAAGSTTGRVILYYTKTEYKKADEITDLLESPSVIAYRFYEGGKWNDETSYTDEEVPGDTPEKKEAYKNNWYGQRFLDVRINKTSDKMLRIVDSDAISYNGLALHAWTVDYDKDLNTVDDRDVFLQIYNFEENSFTHIIKITAKSGMYSTPHFGRYDDNTYLFFSAAGDLGSGEEGGGIAYINISNAIGSGKYTLVEEGATKYYKLQYKEDVEETVTSEGVTVPAHEAVIELNPHYAVRLEGYVNNYSVDVDEDERMYLTWADSVEGNSAEKQIFTSIYDVEQGTEEEADWSEAFVLTDAESTAYGNIDAAVINGLLYVAADKIPYVVTEENTSLDEANTSMVVLQHTPYSSPATVEENPLSTDTHYVYPDTGFKLTSTVKNEGTKFINEPVTFKFTMTAGGATTDLGTQTLSYLWGAGRLMSASIDVPALGEVADDLTFDAEVTIGDTVINQSMRAVKEYNIILDGDALLEETTGGHQLSVPLRNDGNIPSGEAAVKLYTVKDGAADKLIKEFDTGSIAENSTLIIGGAVKIPDEAYVIDRGDGIADIIAVAEAGGEALATLETKAHRSFDADAISTMSKVTGVAVKGASNIAAGYLDDISIETKVTGDIGDDEVKIAWQSNNTDAVYVRTDGTLCAVGTGTARLTGYVVPSAQSVIFSYDGTSRAQDLLEAIPSTLYKTVTVQVTVTDDTSDPTTEKPDIRDRKTPGTPAAPVQEGAPEETPAETTAPENVEFGDIEKHWAKGYIERLSELGIINGMGGGNFAPDSHMTRAQAAKMFMGIGLVEGGNAVVGEFTDVAADAWYRECVEWAVRNGISEGMGNGTYAPDGGITREQMAVMAYNFMKIAGITGAADIEIAFNDADSISDWAQEAVTALAAMGIINGRDTGGFDPQATITRGESASIICKILDLIKGGLNND